MLQLPAQRTAHLYMKCASMFRARLARTDSWLGGSSIKQPCIMWLTLLVNEASELAFMAQRQHVSAGTPRALGAYELAGRAHL